MLTTFLFTKRLILLIDKKKKKDTYKHSHYSLFINNIHYSI
jgi:hypothetical protein